MSVWERRRSRAELIMRWIKWTHGRSFHCVVLHFKIWWNLLETYWGFIRDVVTRIWLWCVLSSIQFLYSAGRTVATSHKMQVPLMSTPSYDKRFSAANVLLNIRVRTSLIPCSVAWRRGCVVGVAMVRGSNPAGATFSRPVQAGPTAHAAPCAMGTDCVFQGKTAGAWRWLPARILVTPRSNMGRAGNSSGDWV